MKQLKQISFLLIVCTSILASCSKAPNKVLVKKDGTWNAAYTTVTSQTGMPDQTVTGTSTITFDKNGSGHYVDSGSTVNFTWSYNEAATSITMTEDTGNTYTYTVSDMKPNSETWYTEVSVTIGGIVTKISNTIKLTR